MVDPRTNSILSFVAKQISLPPAQALTDDVIIEAAANLDVPQDQLDRIDNALAKPENMSALRSKIEQNSLGPAMVR